MGLAAVVDLLRCPQCARALALEDATVGCPSGHTFDVARQGYLNLSRSAQPKSADTAAMVAARTDFLAAGHYATLTNHIVALAGARSTVVDCGAGTGDYSRHLLDRGLADRALALDVSVAACRRAARAHPRLGAVVADVWRPLPVSDAVADLVLNVFAPRQPAEFARILAPDGLLITVTPQADHLRELRFPLGLLEVEPEKQDRLTSAMSGVLLEVDRVEMRERQLWSAQTASLAVLMGPNAFQLAAAEVRERTARMAWPMEVTVACWVRTWGPAR